MHAVPEEAGDGALMDCLYRGQLPGGGYVIACGRRRKVKCATCKQTDAGLECDGCDKPLCAGCAVSPQKGLDFCPKCFEPAWRAWLSKDAAVKRSLTQAERRAAFREWARTNPYAFIAVVPHSEQSILAQDSALAAAHAERVAKVDAPAHVDPMTPPEDEDE
jgi:hypothetical protein